MGFSYVAKVNNFISRINYRLKYSRHFYQTFCTVEEWALNATPSVLEVFR